MKGWILLVLTLFLLQAAALAAASSFFDGDFEGVPDDDDGLATLFLVLYLLVFGTMLTTQLLPRQRDPSVFDQRLMWADYVKRHTKRKRNIAFTRRLRMELKSFNKLLELIREDLEVNQ
jgi:hypothetical protein